jgi:hypothetical protein
MATQRPVTPGLRTDRARDPARHLRFTTTFETHLEQLGIDKPPKAKPSSRVGVVRLAGGFRGMPLS